MSHFWAKDLVVAILWTIMNLVYELAEQIRELRDVAERNVGKLQTFCQDTLDTEIVGKVALS